MVSVIRKLVVSGSDDHGRGRNGGGGHDDGSSLARQDGGGDDDNVLDDELTVLDPFLLEVASLERVRVADVRGGEGTSAEDSGGDEDRDTHGDVGCGMRNVLMVSVVSMAAAGPL